MRQDVQQFIRDYSKELREGNAAVFAGAGLSRKSGFVDWKGLLQEVASDLGLDVNKEHDLVRVAQYHVNLNSNNRDKLHRALLEEFARDNKPNENHRRLTALPITTYWTTNYDTLIEDALKESGNIVDVKHEVRQLAHTRPRRDATVYKMHGDITQPNSAILTRADFETYHKTHKEFLRALTGDLVSKTFLFIGCGFADPNLDYVLTRIAAEYTTGQRQHFFFALKATKGSGEGESDFQYRKLREELLVIDLKRFGLRAVWLEGFDEIPEILAELGRIYRRDVVFVSGAAHEYGSWSEADALSFSRALAMDLIKENFRIVSGFGLGIGSAVIAGALEEVLINEKRPLRDQLVTRPFPQATGSLDTAKMKALWTEYRGQMLRQAGIAVFIFGNKLDRDSGAVVLSDGMREEFAIAKAEGLLIVPVGATGSIAREFWLEVKADISTYYSPATPEIENGFLALNDAGLQWGDLLKQTIDFIKLIRRQ